MPDVLGTTYDNLRIRILGIERVADSFDYSYGRADPEEIKDASGEVVGFGLGSKRAADFTIGLTTEEFEAAEALARVLGKDLTDAWPFPITVSYWNVVKDGNFFKMQANVLRIRTLTNCVISDVSRPHKVGDKKFVVTLKGKATKVE